MIRKNKYHKREEMIEKKIRKKDKRDFLILHFLQFLNGFIYFSFHKDKRASNCWPLNVSWRHALLSNVIHALQYYCWHRIERPYSNFMFFLSCLQFWIGIVVLCHNYYNLCFSEYFLVIGYPKL